MHMVNELYNINEVQEFYPSVYSNEDIELTSIYAQKKLRRF